MTKNRYVKFKKAKKTNHDKNEKNVSLSLDEFRESHKKLQGINSELENKVIEINEILKRYEQKPYVQN